MIRTLVLCFLKHSSTLVCLTLNHSKHSLHYQGSCSRPLLCLLNGTAVWWVRGSQDSMGISLVEDFKTSLSNFSAHNICIGFPPCPPYHHLIPHQTTCTDATAAASIFLKPPVPAKPEGNRGGLSTLGSVSSWNLAHISSLSSRLLVSLVTSACFPGWY